MRTMTKQPSMLRLFLITLTIVALGGVGLAFAFPGGGPQRAAMSNKAKGKALELVAALNLTPEQASQVAVAIEEMTDIRDNRRELFEAGRQIRREAQAGPGSFTDEERAILQQTREDLREAHRTLTDHAAHVVNTVKGLLTPAQLAVIDGYAADFERKREERQGKQGRSFRGRRGRPVDRLLVGARTLSDAEYFQKREEFFSRFAMRNGLDEGTAATARDAFFAFLDDVRTMTADEFGSQKDDLRNQFRELHQRYFASENLVIGFLLLHEHVLESGALGIE